MDAHPVPADGVDLILLARSPVELDDIDAVAASYRPTAGAVRLACWHEMSSIADDLHVDEVHVVSRVAESQGPAFRRRLRRASVPERLLLHLGRDRWFLEHLAAGSQVVGLDDAARRAVRGLQRLPTASAPPQPLSRASRLLPRSKRARFLRRRAETGASNERERLERTTVLLGRLLDAGEPATAGAVLRDARRTLSTRRLRADLLGSFTALQLGRTEAPTELVATVRAELAVADKQYRSGSTAKAAPAFAEALSVGFNRAVHFDRLDSPLALGPAESSSPFRASEVAKAVRAGRGRDDLPPKSVTSPRILLATAGNANFIASLHDHLKRSGRCTVRAHDFSKDLRSLALDPENVVREVLDGRGGLAERAEKVLRAHLDWADVIVVDWCTSLAVLMTLVDPRATRVIVRLHSFEAFSRWPHLMDFTRVDELVFVSEHLQDLVRSSVPGVVESAVRTSVIPLGIETDHFWRAKSESARFTIGLVGYSQIAKDPRWAFEVVRTLRAQDQRYRLRLIGSDLTVRATASARSYVDAFQREARTLELEGALERRGQSDSVADELAFIGVILSSSVRESFHLAVIEGAASGAVPVVRDWPLFAGAAHGAHTLYPPGWVVSTPQDAAGSILEATADDSRWRQRGQDARDIVRTRWDSATVAPSIDRLLF